MSKSSFHSDSSMKRIARNGGFIAIRFAVYTLSGIFFIPFLIRQYGSGSYGLIALAGFLTQYVGMIARCIGNATARFMNIALNKNEWKQANEIYSTALVANLGFILLQVPFFVLGIWKLDWLIDFPPEIAHDFRALVICNAIVFFVSQFTGVFMTTIQAANRVDISSMIDTFRLTARLILIYSLIKLTGASLWIIGAVDLGLSFFTAVIVFLLRRKMAPLLRFGFQYITKAWIRPVMSMAGWSLVTVLGGCLFIKTDVWMINRFVNKEIAGIYAALLVWPNFYKQVGKQLASILMPVYMIDYARGDLERVAKFSLSGAKLLACFAAAVSGILCVIAGPLLRIWLGEEAVQYVPLLRVMTIYLAFTLGDEVLWQIFVTLNKVHFTGMVNLAAGVVNVVVSLTLIHFGLGAMGVAVGTMLAKILSSGLAIPLGACRALKIPGKIVWMNYLSAAMVLLISLTASAASYYMVRISPVAAALTFISLLIIGSVLAIKYIFSETERALLMNVFQRVLGKLRTRNDNPS